MIGEIKLSLFPDSLIVYVKYPKEPRGKKLLQLTQRKRLRLDREPRSPDSWPAKAGPHAPPAVMAALCPAPPGPPLNDRPKFQLHLLKTHSGYLCLLPVPGVLVRRGLSPAWGEDLPTSSPTC